MGRGLKVREKVFTEEGDEGVGCSTGDDGHDLFSRRIAGVCVCVFVQIRQRAEGRGERRLTK